MLKRPYYNTLLTVRLKSSVTYRHVDWQIVADVSEEIAASIFRVYAAQKPTILVLLRP
jgi:hypothetical protein